MSMRDPVFYQIMQSALTRAYPSGLPSNQVLTQFSAPYESVTIPDSLKATLYQIGYPYGWVEDTGVNGAGTYELTEPMSACWLLRLNAFKPSGSTVSLSAAIGGGAQQTIQRIDPAQTLVYADDLFAWSTAFPLGRVGISPYGTPTGWTDSSAEWMGPVSGAASSAPIGEWLLRKWVWFGSTGQYTFNLAADASANLFLDGNSVISGATLASTSTVTQQVTAGWHLLSASCLRTGNTPSPTGVLVSITDSNGNVIENGSYHPIIGIQWETSGYINPTWTAVSTEDDMRHAWYVIPASEITSENVSLTVSVTGSPLINGLTWYSVAPWRWDEGGQYDATASASTPAQVNPVQTVEVVG